MANRFQLVLLSVTVSSLLLLSVGGIADLTYIVAFLESSLEHTHTNENPYLLQLTSIDVRYWGLSRKKEQKMKLIYYDCRFFSYTSLPLPNTTNNVRRPCGGRSAGATLYPTAVCFGLNQARLIQVKTLNDLGVHCMHLHATANSLIVRTYMANKAHSDSVSDLFWDSTGMWTRSSISHRQASARGTERVQLTHFRMFQLFLHKQTLWVMCTVCCKAALIFRSLKW